MVDNPDDQGIRRDDDPPFEFQCSRSQCTYACNSTEVFLRHCRVNHSVDHLLVCRSCKQLPKHVFKSMKGTLKHIDSIHQACRPRFAIYTSSIAGLDAKLELNSHKLKITIHCTHLHCKFKTKDTASFRCHTAESHGRQCSDDSVSDGGCETDSLVDRDDDEMGDTNTNRGDDDVMDDNDEDVDVMDDNDEDDGVSNNKDVDNRDADHGLGKVNLKIDTTNSDDLDNDVNGLSNVTSDLWNKSPKDEHKTTAERNGKMSPCKEKKTKKRKLVKISAQLFDGVVKNRNSPIKDEGCSGSDVVSNSIGEKNSSLKNVKSLESNLLSRAISIRSNEKCSVSKYSELVIDNASHGKRVPTECPICHLLRVNMSQHSLVHTRERPYSCNECSYTARRKKDLDLHSLVHTSVKTLVCPECEKTFLSHSDLAKHNKIHIGIKKYKCDKCGKRFLHGHHFKYHYTHVHRPTKIIAAGASAS